jgi:hypothetical protein
MNCPISTCSSGPSMNSLAATECAACIVKQLVRQSPTSPDIQLALPPEMPLAVSETKLIIVDRALAGGTIRVLNTYNAGLVTLILAVRAENDLSQSARLVVVNDSWDRGIAFLGAGQERDIDFPFRTLAPVRKLLLVPIYAEFDNGERVGPVAGTAAPCLLSERQNIVDFDSQLLGMYQAGGAAAVVEAINTSDTSHALWLKFVQQESGIRGVLAAISRNRRLRP